MICFLLLGAVLAIIALQAQGPEGAQYVGLTEPDRALEFPHLRRQVWRRANAQHRVAGGDRTAPSGAYPRRRKGIATDNAAAAAGVPGVHDQLAAGAYLRVQEIAPHDNVAAGHHRAVVDEFRLQVTEGDDAGMIADDAARNDDVALGIDGSTRFDLTADGDAALGADGETRAHRAGNVHVLTDIDVAQRIVDVALYGQQLVY
jgi:hypothetical protein